MATHPYRVDYHAHTVLCSHAHGTVDDYLERAQALGLSEFGFSEHSHWMVKTGSRKLAPTPEEMQTYLQWMDERRAFWNGEDGRPKLRVGLEADWVPERLEEALAFIASYPFDYVIGSVHHVRHPRYPDQWVIGWGYEAEDARAICETYFEEMAKLAESGLCDILAHLDVIRRGAKLPPEGVLPYLEPIVPRIAASGVAVEINTSGRDHMLLLGEPNTFFPSREALGMLVDAGVPITFGSDSHAPGHVGRYLEIAMDWLRDAGAKSFARFEGRKMFEVEL
ncbi:MAG: histidinol-phosphatase [Sumerlaeia bacterium]